MEEEPPFVERPWIARWLDDGSTFVFTRVLILRLLGGVYFVAFLGTMIQGRALIGEHGLLPMKGYLAAAARAGAGFFDAPSIFWLNASDAMLLAVTGIGAALAFAVMLGVTNAGVMLVLWAIQMSLYDVGQIFWGYGWEIQLLETGMLAAVLCPLTTWRPFASAPPAIAIWLFRWLIVRIMLGAGLIKIRGDACWRALTCLDTHYETQPNPSPLSWAFHHAPHWSHVAGVAVNHAVELVVPFLVFGPRPARRAAGVILIGFQVVLIASGNLAFLNWLTIVPAIACLDDSLLMGLVTLGLRPKPRPTGARRLASLPWGPKIAPHEGARRLAFLSWGPDLRRWMRSVDPAGILVGRWHRRIAIGYAILVGVLSFGPTINLFSERQAMNASFDPLHLVNTYGAFGSVNAVRNEIVLEGSHDGVTWEEYELPCKPGDPMRRPCLVSPYHYRLDWQMWFAAMSSYEEEPWIVELVDELLRGDRAIRPLFASDPFANGPPRMVRAELYRYEFTRPGEPGWWRRTRVGEYLRPVALGDPELESFLSLHRVR